jgi:predicted hotdog family 3-hydroxylacyl-ACP dehydratase
MNDAASVDVEALIPHRLPMRLVETITSVDEVNVVTTAVVRDTWPTVREGRAQTLMLIELIAQTAAVLQGWRERHTGKAGSGGLLVGIHEAKAQTTTLPVGTPLICTVHITHGAQNYLAFTGQVVGTDGAPWLTGSIQAYRPDSLETPGESS